MTSASLQFIRDCAAGFVLSVMFVADVSAHELRPAYLEIRETDAARYELVWKVPVRQGRPLFVEPQFPPDCVVGGQQARDQDGEALIVRFDLSCESGLPGRSIGFRNLDGTLTDVLIRASLEGGSQATRATPRSPVVVLPTKP